MGATYATKNKEDRRPGGIKSRQGYVTKVANGTTHITLFNRHGQHTGRLRTNSEYCARNPKGRKIHGERFTPDQSIVGRIVQCTYDGDGKTLMDWIVSDKEFQGTPKEPGDGKKNSRARRGGKKNRGKSVRPGTEASSPTGTTKKRGKKSRHLSRRPEPASSRELK